MCSLTLQEWHVDRLRSSLHLQAPLQSQFKTQADDRPNFEREFFQDNSSSDNDSQNNASDSSDNESEEEAKHF